MFLFFLNFHQTYIHTYIHKHIISQFRSNYFIVTHLQWWIEAFENSKKNTKDVELTILVDVRW